jgi:drug/metabolite transporter (DMT)-like permease
VHDIVANSPRRTRTTPLILACLAATWLIWGSTYLAIRFALKGFPPFLMMGTRFLTAGIVLLVWTRALGSPLPTGREWWHALLIGTLMLGGGMGGTAYAELTIGSGLVVAFIAVVPLLLVTMNLAFRVYPTRGEIAGLLVGFAGVLMLTQGAGYKASPVGLAAITIACFAWALGSALSQRVLRLAPGATGFASEMLCGGGALLLLSLLSGEQAAWPAQAGPWFAWAYLVVFGSLIAFNAYMLLLGRTSPSLATSYTFVNPLVGLLLGVTLGGEQVSAWEWASAGVVVAGVVLVVASATLTRGAQQT